MKNPIRLQSQLLIRRSYKPRRVARRRLDITFQPARPVAVLISKIGNDTSTDRVTPVEIVLTG